jgi:hypothetical protein
MQANHWLPLTEYALRSGVSISTLRRKIKANSIEFKMEEGRYLIRSDLLEEAPIASIGFASSDAPLAKPVVFSEEPSPKALPPLPPLPKSALLSEELSQIRQEIARSRAEDSLRWRALEARIAGLARRLEQYSEQMAEVKMLVKIFEEKLDGRL